MNFFKSIGLSGDPFSTSPNTQLFYNATGHRQCLEGLELAIRMRRGLSVVQGGVGVGKTTVSRMLIQLFEDKSDIYDFYLILDPKFETELYLLQHLIELFGIREKGVTVQDCRDIIESYLLKVGVEQNKVLVLIIDEGQNLESKYLDVFRTLLNFETDDYKLLQLIIFGQPEMESNIQQYPNFEDRISFKFKIDPLGLDQMRGLIYHRLKMSGASENNWFPDNIIELIYNQTNGFPRKVSKLCHDLLLHMISDEKKQVDDEIFQNVIDGKPPVNLFKIEDDEPSKVAANKLLNVIRKKKKESPVPEFIEDDDGDEIIGGNGPNTALETDSNNELSKDDDVIGKSSEPDIEKEEEPFIPVVAADQIRESNLIAEPFKNAGQVPKGISTPVIFKDETTLGIAVDGNKIIAISLQDHRKIKRLIDIQIYEHSQNIDFAQNPTEALNALNALMELCKQSAIKKDFLLKRTIESITNGASIALSINSQLMQLKKINIPKNSQNDRKKIIAWNAKNQLSFDADLLLYDSVNLGTSKESLLVGTTNSQLLNQASNIFSEQDWSIQRWHPVTMAIHNAFIWNYPEESKETCYLLHLGESESYILGYTLGLLQVISPISIGIQNLKDVLTKSSKNEYRVPPTLIPGKNETKNKSDDQFRPIIESWTREIDRTLNSYKRSFPIGEIKRMYLSGAAIHIKSIDEYLSNHLQLQTEYINPLRNISILPDESERENINFAMPLLTAAVGSALNLSNTINLRPATMKQKESFRFLLSRGIKIAAGLLISLFLFTGWISFQNNKFNDELASLKKELSLLEPFKDSFYSINDQKTSIEAQINQLSYDTKYFDRILMTLRFISHNTPSEITFDEIRFQMGWEETKYYLEGNIRKPELQITDPNLRILKLSGTVSANSAYKDRILQIYMDGLETASLFSEIVIMSKHTSVGLDVKEMNFVLKCIL